LQRAASLEGQARQSERLAFVGALASGLAHEVRNPLSTLRLNLQLLAEDLENPDSVPAPRMRSRVQVLRREVERLNDVLNDYLRFARQRQLEREPANLNDVLDELLEFVRPEGLRRNVEIRHQFAPDVPRAALDVNLLKQALLNLIVNSFEAMPEGGELIVQTETDGATVTVRLTDTGCGIPPDEVDKVFRVYYSTKQTGTGLGLPTARRIVQEHGGALHLSSQPNRGTQVAITLPVEPEADDEQGPPIALTD
ncbi:MAG: two-component sensor histidine kinase, partial [Planctomycetes bacterium]|nr:two-component sensor histidine kinase [Planctomycetota bacterium]